MGKKRSRLEIIRDILVVIKEKSGKIKPTHILYKSNLSHQMMDEYLTELLKKGFIEEGEREDKGRTYCITKKGQMFLERYKMIADFTEGFGIG